MKCTLSGCDRCTVEATTRRRPQPAPAAPKRWWVEFTDLVGDAYTAASAGWPTLSAAYAYATGHILPDDRAKPRVYFAAEPRPFRRGDVKAVSLTYRYEGTVLQ